MPLAHSTEPKWDWDVIRALYIGGMSLKEIIEIPRYRDLSMNYLQKRASQQKWHAAREQARAEGAGEIARPLIKKMADAEEIHQQWLLTNLASERKIFDEYKTKNKGGGKEQRERLEIIRSLDDVARRQLGLDDRKPINDQQRNLGILISINMNGGPQPKTITAEMVEQAKPSVVGTEDPRVLAEVQAALQEAHQPPEPRPFRVKGEPPPEPLVNEKDIVQVLQDAGYQTLTGDQVMELVKREGEDE